MHARTHTHMLACLHHVTYSHTHTHRCADARRHIHPHTQHLTRGEQTSTFSSNRFLAKIQTNTKNSLAGDLGGDVWWWNCCPPSGESIDPAAPAFIASCSDVILACAVCFNPASLSLPRSCSGIVYDCQDRLLDGGWLCGVVGGKGKVEQGEGWGILSLLNFKPRGKVTDSDGLKDWFPFHMCVWE